MLSTFAETMEDGKRAHMLHHPKLLTGWLNPDYKEDVPETTAVLRGTAHYRDFLFLFGRFGAKTEQFKRRHTNSLFSSFVATSMEAFLITVYTLNYNFWMEKTDLEEGERPAKEKTHLLTRGSPDNGGWTEETVVMYVNIAEKIREDRKNWAFDQMLQEEWVKEYSGTSTGQKNNRSDEYSKVSARMDFDFEENCERNHGYSKVPI